MRQKKIKSINCANTETVALEKNSIRSYDVALSMKLTAKIERTPNKSWSNIFELVFTLCHKCNKYNCLPWNMLNHTGNSNITRLKQLCHPPDTVMPYRTQLYHYLAYLSCMLIRLGLRCNVTVAKQNKQRSWILKQKEESRAVCSILFAFVFI